MALPLAAVAVGGSLVSSLIGGIFGSKASKAQARAQQAAIDEQRRQYDLTRADFEPWRTTGGSALERIAAYYGLNGQPADPSVFTSSPDYAFVRDEGLRAIDRSNAARGLLNSGAADRSRMRYGEGLASSEFNNWWNRLSGLAGTGQNAATTTAQLGANTSSNISSLLTQQGNARASSYANWGSQANNGINNVLSAYFMDRMGAFGGGK